MGIDRHDYIAEIELLRAEVLALLPHDAVPPFLDPESNEIVREFFKIEETLTKIRSLAPGVVVKNSTKLVSEIRSSVQSLRARYRPN